MINTGRMMAYPIGGDDGLCTADLPALPGRPGLAVAEAAAIPGAALCGAVCAGPGRGCAAPLSLWRLLPAVAARGPDHLPGGGAGVAALIGRLRTVVQQRQAVNLAGGLFAAVGLEGLLIDVL